MASIVRDGAPEFVRDVTSVMMAGRGDTLPVSALPVDGTYPTATAMWERRNLATEIPIWDENICIQCNKCTLVCPHAAIRAKVYEPAVLKGAPDGFKTINYRGKEHPDFKYTLQVAPEDCTGCGICVEVCPAKNKSEAKFKAINMQPQAPLRKRERDWYDFFLELPEVDRSTVKLGTVKGSQLLQPLFEYSGACAGCGETPYLKLLTQLYGDRLMVANATGCSSIFGGNLPTTPWSTNKQGLGPVWSNSLFEDNAEFGLGFRLTVDKLTAQARGSLKEMGASLKGADAILQAAQGDEAEIHTQRERVVELKEQLAAIDTPQAKQLMSMADYLVEKSVWIVGGDGWAYDIGYGGLDHVLASGRNVNILVLDTEVYSNTGGQASKATPRGAVAKFAAAGRDAAKKDLGMLAMAYGNVYVAQIAMGANDAQSVKAFIEAESYPGVSLIIAYSHCIAHGIDMRTANEQQKAAVDCAHWPLYRYDPRVEGKHLHLDSRAPKIRFEDYAYRETRYRMLAQSMPERAADLMKRAKGDAATRWETLQHMSNLQSTTEE
jgi:pyruvate-ferredoxin/flavodoxin oxidoreductase